MPSWWSSPALIEEEAPSRLVAGGSDLYVAMTRPTQRLAIVRTSAGRTGTLNI